MALPLYSCVKLTTDRFALEGARAGMIGYVIEDRGHGKYEVEFSDSRDGTTIAQIVTDESDLTLVPDDPVP